MLQRGVRRRPSPQPSPRRRGEGARRGRLSHVPLRRVRRGVRAPARGAVPRPGGAPALGRADRGPVQAAAADERPLPAAPRLHAAHRRPLRHAELAPAAQAGPHRPRPTTAATATSRRARTCSSTGPSWPTSRRSSTSWPRSRCTPSRPRGNCIRNVTTDHFAGATADEVDDPRPYAEIIRQWSTLHPEFSFLPRKFKIAVTAAEQDRAAIQVHDIGLHLKRLADGALGFEVWVGGGHGPHADHRQDDSRLPARGGPAELPGGHPARLQSARPARQQVQGAHQDPGARDRRRGLRARRSRRSGSASATAR